MQKIKIYFKQLFRNLFHNHTFEADREIVDAEMQCLCCDKKYVLEQIIYGVRCKTCFAFIPAHVDLTQESSDKLTQYHEDEDNNDFAKR